MIVPEHWAEAKSTQRIGGHQVTLRRFGWSDQSLDAARRHAQERLAEAVSRWESGETPVRRERKVPYNGADGLPIREEIVGRVGDTVLTRNSYGAICLNTPDVLFADIDFEEEPPLLFLVCALAVSWGLCFLLLREAGLRGAPLAAIVGAVVLGVPLARWMHGLRNRAGGGQASIVDRRIRRFSAANPDWNLRVYRTPAGRRVLAMHRTFEPRDDEVGKLFRSLGVDRTYAVMCRTQNCFRARVSPKPWRVDYEPRLRPRPGVWPVDPDRLPERRRWIEGYDRACVGFASCSFQEQLGSPDVDPRAEEVRRVHDQHSQAERDLPIA